VTNDGKLLAPFETDEAGSSSTLKGECMSASAASESPVFAVDVALAPDASRVTLSDGETLRVPLRLFLRLRDATPAQRLRWRLIAGGIGIHWEDLDEDLSVDGLLRSAGAEVTVERAA